MNIKQIANIAGVSPSSVSMVLNNRKGVSDETRKKIQQVIEDSQYTPNVNSRRLILQRSFNIFLVLDNKASVYNDTFYTAVMQAIVNRGSELGYNIVLAVKTDLVKKSPIFEAIQQRNLDGILFLGDIEAELQSFLQSREVPYVVVDSHRENPGYVCVKGDYELSAYIATRFLIEQGHKNIGMIGMGAIPEFYLTTFAGYKRAVEEAKLTCRLEWIQMDVNDEFAGYRCMTNILQVDELPTAIFCAGDILAIGAMNRAREAGLSIPGDISFCGLDDILLARYCLPQLTTISVDKAEMGVISIELLNRLIEKHPVDNITRIRSDKLVIRQSVRRLPVIKL